MASLYVGKVSTTMWFVLLFYSSFAVHGSFGLNIMNIRTRKVSKMIHFSSNNKLMSYSVSAKAQYQYSPASIRHLEKVESKRTYDRPWTGAKIRATAGAFGVGSISFIVGSYVSNILIGDDKMGLILGVVGIAGGWYLSGGRQVMENEEKSISKTGGYDSMLVADRPSRLKVILNDFEERGINSVIKSKDGDRDITEAVKYIKKVHGSTYFEVVKKKSKELEAEDRIVRFNQFYARTLIDKNSFHAAIHAVQDWLDSVDVALQGQLLFSLTRPPGHHACKEKAMGGCLFNGAAIAAVYALDQIGVNNVAILDIDAHHGNGIAHCVQDEERIRYCSIHEDTVSSKWVEQKVLEDDPRSSDSYDRGPLMNILNVNIKPGTGWTNGYEEAFTCQAIPFLLDGDPDILIVAAGFDALQTDWSSKLQLQPCDYRRIGGELRSNFNKVAIGLEGGYSYENHALSEAVFEFGSSWD